MIAGTGNDNSALEDKATLLKLSCEPMPVEQVSCVFTGPFSSPSALSVANIQTVLSHHRHRAVHGVTR